MWCYGLTAPSSSRVMMQGSARCGQPPCHCTMGALRGANTDATFIPPAALWQTMGAAQHNRCTVALFGGQVVAQMPQHPQCVKHWFFWHTAAPAPAPPLTLLQGDPALPFHLGHGNLNGDGFGIGWFPTEDRRDRDPTPCVFTSITPAWWVQGWGGSTYPQSLMLRWVGEAT
jgi:hypothetical protein